MITEQSRSITPSGSSFIVNLVYRAEPPTNGIGTINVFLADGVDRQFPFSCTTFATAELEVVHGQLPFNVEVFSCEDTDNNTPGLSFGFGPYFPGGATPGATLNPCLNWSLDPTFLTPQQEACFSARAETQRLVDELALICQQIGHQSRIRDQANDSFKHLMTSALAVAAAAAAAAASLPWPANLIVGAIIGIVAIVLFAFAYEQLSTRNSADRQIRQLRNRQRDLTEQYHRAAQSMRDSCCDRYPIPPAPSC